MATAILGIALPLDQSSLLELVEHAHELAAVEVEHVGDRRLGSTRPDAEGRQHSVLVQGEPLLLELLDQPCLERVTQTGQEEERASEELLWDLGWAGLCLGLGGIHAKKSSAADRCCVLSWTNFNDWSHR